MTHPLGKPETKMNEVAREMATLQLTTAMAICQEQHVQDAEVLAAVVLALALNVNSLHRK